MGRLPCPDYASPFALAPWPTGTGRAAPCGDLDGDGVAELCLAEGVLFGPLVEDDLPDVSWTAEDPRVTAADLDGDGVNELFVSDAALHALYRLASLTPAGPSPSAPSPPRPGTRTTAPLPRWRPGTSTETASRTW